MSKATIESLQVLRAIAAILVVFHHSKDFSLEYGHQNWAIDFLSTGIGAFGVDIFFVLSGFIMFYTAREATSGRTFLINRLARVAPMYWLATSFLAALLILAPGLFGSMSFDFGYYIKSILFMPHNSPSGDYLPLLGVGWTLCFEMCFCFVFAVLMRFRSEALLLLSCYFLLMTVFGVIFSGHGSRLMWTLTSSLNMEFFLGTLLAYLMRDYGGAHLLRDIAWGIPAAVIVCGFLMLSKIRFVRAATVLGVSSYSLCLIHMLSLPFAWKLAAHVGIQLSEIFLMIGAVLFSVLVSIVAWVYIEQPISRNFRKLLPGAAGANMSGASRRTSA